MTKKQTVASIIFNRLTIGQKLKYLTAHVIEQGDKSTAAVQKELWGIWSGIEDRRERHECAVSIFKKADPNSVFADQALNNALSTCSPPYDDYDELKILKDLPAQSPFHGRVTQRILDIVDTQLEEKDLHSVWFMNPYILDKTLKASIEDKMFAFIGAMPPVERFETVMKYKEYSNPGNPLYQKALETALDTVDFLPTRKERNDAAFQILRKGSIYSADIAKKALETITAFPAGRQYDVAFKSAQKCPLSYTGHDHFGVWISCIELALGDISNQKKDPKNRLRAFADLYLESCRDECHDSVRSITLNRVVADIRKGIFETAETMPVTERKGALVKVAHQVGNGYRLWNEIANYLHENKAILESAITPVRGADRPRLVA